MEKISKFTFDHLIESARHEIYEANKRDLKELREKLEAVYIVDVEEFDLDERSAVVECCLETYEHCAEMTCDTLYHFLKELIPWLERYVKQESQQSDQ